MSTGTNDNLPELASSWSTAVVRINAIIEAAESLPEITGAMGAAKLSTRSQEGRVRLGHPEPVRRVATSGRAPGRRDVSGGYSSSVTRPQVESVGGHDT